MDIHLRPLNNMLPQVESGTSYDTNPSWSTRDSSSYYDLGNASGLYKANYSNLEGFVTSSGASVNWYAQSGTHTFTGDYSGQIVFAQAFSSYAFSSGYSRLSSSSYLQPSLNPDASASYAPVAFVNEIKQEETYEFSVSNSSSMQRVHSEFDYWYSSGTGFGQSSSGSTGSTWTSSSFTDWQSAWVASSSSGSHMSFIEFVGGSYTQSRSWFYNFNLSQTRTFSRSRYYSDSSTSYSATSSGTSKLFERQESWGNSFRTGNSSSMARDYDSNSSGSWYGSQGSRRTQSHIFDAIQQGSDGSYSINGGNIEQHSSASAWIGVNSTQFVTYQAYKNLSSGFSEQNGMSNSFIASGNASSSGVSRNLIGSGGFSYSYTSYDRNSNWETRSSSGLPNASGNNWFYFYQAYEFDSEVAQGLRNTNSSSSSWSNIELSYLRVVTV